MTKFAGEAIDKGRGVGELTTVPRRLLRLYEGLSVDASLSDPQACVLAPLTTEAENAHFDQLGALLHVEGQRVEHYDRGHPNKGRNCDRRKQESPDRDAHSPCYKEFQLAA